MKNVITRMMFLLICFLISADLYALDVTIDNISYSLDLGARTASVTGSTLEHVVVPETIVYDDVSYEVTSIAPAAFKGNQIIKSIKTGNSLKSILTGDYSYYYGYVSTKNENGAFHGATNLQEADFGENLVEIGGGAFYYATNLKKINVGNKLAKIGDSAFKGCTNLKYIVLPTTIYSIGSFSEPYNMYNTFYGISQLSIICLKNGFNTGYPKQTIYPSSFFTFSDNTFDYNGRQPEVNYTFNGIGSGFQPTEVNMANLEKTAGTHTTNLSCTFANSDMSFTVDIPYNYTITPGLLTAKVKSATRLYGDANPQFEVELSGFITGEDASVVSNFGTFSTTATVSSDVGTYPVTLSGAMAQNYTFQYESGTLTVTKAPLTMTARNKTMTYGGQVPTLEADYEGLKNNETKPVWTTSPQITTTATMASNAGTYPITISNGVAKNYDVTFKPGTLTINKASLTATTKNATRAYGDDDPQFTMSYSGLKNGDTVPEWITAPTITSTATKTSQVGTYNINASGGEARNYNVSYVNSGKLTVTKAMLTATARSCMKRQGEDNPTLVIDYEGFKNNETTLALTKVPVATTTATLNSTPGTYPITISGGQAINYDFTYISGTLTILPREEPGDPTANVLTINNITGNKSVSTILPIALTNEKSITAFQFDLYLPNGVSVAKKSNGKMMIETTERMEGTYSISSNTIDNFVRVTGYSAEGDAFTGNNGDILNITLDISDAVDDGDYTISIKDIVLSDVNNTEYHPANAEGTLTVKSYTLGDVDNSGAVNINDVVCIINHILNKPVSVFIEEAADVDGSGSININDVVTLINRFILMKTGAPALMESQAPQLAVADDNYLHLATIDIKLGETLEIPMLMTNANTVAAIQGNIKLPEGLTFVTKSNGRIDVKNNDSRAEDFTLSCGLQSDGSLTFAQYSADGFTYEGSEGTIFTFKIQAAADVTPGTYNIVLSNVVLSIDGVGYEYPESTSILNITGTDGISNIKGISEHETYHTLDGREVKNPGKGIYIVNGKKVMIK